MPIIAILAIIIGLFFAINIGGSGAAPAMAAAYGAGSISRKNALIMTAIFSLLGAVLGGRAVIKTVSSGIIPVRLLTFEVAAVILLAASLSLFFANLIKVPLSTSQVTVGAVTGVGLYFGLLYTRSLLVIVLFWLALPAASYLIAYVFGRYLDPKILRWLANLRSESKIHKALDLMLIGSGCYVAFSIGANNAANAIGPLVGAKIINIWTGALVGGIFIGVGALIMGGKTMHTAGKEITELCVVKASLVSFTAGSLIIFASALGIPAPLVQVSTVAIVGIGASRRCNDNPFDNGVVKKIIKVWILSPFISLALSFILMFFIRLPSF